MNNSCCPTENKGSDTKHVLQGARSHVDDLEVYTVGTGLSFLFSSLFFFLFIFSGSFRSQHSCCNPRYIWTFGKFTAIYRRACDKERFEVCCCGLLSGKGSLPCIWKRCCHNSQRANRGRLRIFLRSPDKTSRNGSARRCHLRKSVWTRYMSWHV
jgi:hypothetical protein